MRWILVSAMLGSTWYVAPGGTGNGKSSTTPFGKVQSGIDAADAGDTVSLASGTYLENVFAVKDQVTLVAPSGAAVIDGELGAGQGKAALSVHGVGWVIDGVTFVDGGGYNLRIDGTTDAGLCPGDGGVILAGIHTGGFVSPPSHFCDAGTAGGSTDVLIQCLKGAWVHDSQLAGRACDQGLSLASLNGAVLVEENDLSRSGNIELEVLAVDGGEIRRNYLHDCCDVVARGVPFGMHLDTGSRNIFVHHNLVVRPGTYGIAAYDSSAWGQNDTIENNTIVAPKECGIRFKHVAATLHANLVSAPLCSGSSCSDNPCKVPCGVAVLADAGGVVENVGFDLFDGVTVAYCLSAPKSNVVDGGPFTLDSPGFVDAGAGDYRLTACSPAAGAGDPNAPSGTDYAGNPFPAPGLGPSIGAYEEELACDAGVDAGAMDGGADAGASDAGRSPVARISPATSTVDAGVLVVLDGTFSTASPGATLSSFQWLELTGPSGVPLTNAPQQQMTPVVPGTYQFQLVVQDTSGASSAPAVATVSVNGDDLPPPYRSGCGCDGQGAPVWFGLALLAWALKGRAGSRAG